MHMQTAQHIKLSIDLFMSYDGSLVVVGRDQKPRRMESEAQAMAFMWAKCNVPPQEFKVALKEMKHNRHTRANFGILRGTFMFTDGLSL